MAQLDVFLNALMGPISTLRPVKYAVVLAKLAKLLRKIA
jgi:hypothetical protein